MNDGPGFGCVIIFAVIAFAFAMVSWGSCENENDALNSFCNAKHAGFYHVDKFSIRENKYVVCKYVDEFEVHQLGR